MAAGFESAHPLFPQLQRELGVLRGLRSAISRTDACKADSVVARGDVEVDRGVSMALRLVQRSNRARHSAFARFEEAAARIRDDAIARVAGSGRIEEDHVRTVESRPARVGRIARPTVPKGKTMPPDVTNTLMKWFLDHKEHPFPSQAEKDELMARTGLDATQMRNWFTNQRKRHWRPVRDGREPRSQLELILKETVA